MRADRIWVASLVVLSGLSLASAAALAQSEVDADFAAYCRANFSGSQYQRSGTDHRCRQGTTLQGIDFSEACRLTTGNPSFRRLDWRVLCAAGDGSEEPASAPSDAPLEAHEFTRYCPQKYPNSGYEKRAETWGTVHYCRRAGATGGYSLQQIDFSDACRVLRDADTYEMDGNQVRCKEGPGGQPRPVANLPGPGPAPTPPPGPPPFPPPQPDPAPVPNAQPAPQPPPAPFPGAPPMPMPGMPSAAPGSMSPEERVARNCASLGGKWRSGTERDVAEITAGWRKALADREANCGPQRGPGDRCLIAVGVEESVSAYFRTLLIYQCHAELVRNPDPWKADDVRTARQEGCAIEQTLTDLQGKTNRNEGRMQFAPHEKILESMGISSLCDEAVVRFVHPSSPGEDGADKLPFFEPIHVEVEFQKAQEESSRQVTVKTEHSSITVEVFQETPKLYRSRIPFVLEEATSVDVSP